MAQNFRRYTANNVGTSPVTVFTSNSYDTVVGIHVTNVTTSSILVDVYINDGSNDNTYTLLNNCDFIKSIHLKKNFGTRKFYHIGPPRDFDLFKDFEKLRSNNLI